MEPQAVEAISFTDVSSVVPAQTSALAPESGTAAHSLPIEGSSVSNPINYMPDPALVEELHAHPLPDLALAPATPEEVTEAEDRLPAIVVGVTPKVQPVEFTVFAPYLESNGTTTTPEEDSSPEESVSLSQPLDQSSPSDPSGEPETSTTDVELSSDSFDLVVPRPTLIPQDSCSSVETSQSTTSSESSGGEPRGYLWRPKSRFTCHNVNAVSVQTAVSGVSLCPLVTLTVADRKTPEPLFDPLRQYLQGDMDEEHPPPLRPSAWSVLNHSRGVKEPQIPQPTNGKRQSAEGISATQFPANGQVHASFVTNHGASSPSDSSEPRPSHRNSIDHNSLAKAASSSETSTASIISSSAAPAVAQGSMSSPASTTRPSTCSANAMGPSSASSKSEGSGPASLEVIQLASSSLGGMGLSPDPHGTVRPSTVSLEAMGPSAASLGAIGSSPAPGVATGPSPFSLVVAISQRCDSSDLTGPCSLATETTYPMTSSTGAIKRTPSAMPRTNQGHTSVRHRRVSLESGPDTRQSWDRAPGEGQEELTHRSFTRKGSLAQHMPHELRNPRQTRIPGVEASSPRSVLDYPKAWI